jgi:hypothetical protein
MLLLFVGSAVYAKRREAKHGDGDKSDGPNPVEILLP